MNSVSVGASLLAATEMGIFKSLDDAAAHVQIAEEYKHNEHHHKTYMNYFEIFESLSTKLEDEFTKIAELQ